MQGMIQTDDASSRCIQLIRNRCGVVIQELQATLQDNQVQITGVIGSWHGKQLASEAARSLFPDRRISNQIKVVKTR
jgi:hypothetical protein